jgi:hypothetical protein
MLSATKKGQDGNALDFFPFKSLYEVLDSMQDLRQHIAGVSLDEIAEAEEKAKRLILRLSSLQTGLANLDKVKLFLAKVEEADPTPSLEIEAGAQTPLPNLEAIRQLLGKTKETILSEAVESKGASKTTLPSVDILKAVLAKAKETTLTELVENKIEPRKESSKRNPQGQGAKIPSNLIPFPGPSKTAKEESKLASSGGPLLSQHREGAKDQDTPLEKALLLAESQLAVEDQTSRANLDIGREDKDGSSTVHAFTLGETQLGEEKFELGFALDAKANEEKDQIAPSSQTQPISSSSSSKRDGEAAKLEKPFDQELLDSLIKDYGEFTIYTKLSAETKKENAAAPNHLQSKLPQRSAANTDLIYDPDTRSWQKKEVALDKKLKKLMTAYGKVDKYSTNRSDNIKKAAVGIIVLLIIAMIAVSFIAFRQTPAPMAQSGAPNTPTGASTEPANSLVPSSISTKTLQPTKKMPLKAEAEKESPARKSPSEKEE